MNPPSLLICFATFLRMNICVSSSFASAPLKRCKFSIGFRWVMLLCSVPPIQSETSDCEKGFVRVPQAVGLNCSCRAAQVSKGNVQKTFYKTFFTTWRPRLYWPDGARQYFSHISGQPLSYLPHPAFTHLCHSQIMNGLLVLNHNKTWNEMKDCLWLVGG